MKTTAFNQELYDAAISYLQAGLSLIPVSQKTKRPLEDLLPMDPETGKGTWNPYRERQPTESEVRYWIERGAQLAVVCGPISGGLRIYDYDVPEKYDAWKAQVGDLATDLPVQQTGGGGYQVAMRCPDVGKNEKLAWVPDTNEASGRSIAIETRGDGGYAVIAPSIHPTGQRYQLLSGNFTQIPTVCQAVIDTFDLAARKLDEAPYSKQQLDAMVRAMQQTPPQRQSVNGQGAVIDAYNQAVSIEDALKQAGYRHVHGSRYARPGGTNPSIEVRDGRSFHHNTNDPLCDGYWHDAFDVHCFYNHYSNVKEAVKIAAIALGLAYTQHSNGASSTQASTGTTQPPPPPQRKLIHANDLKKLPPSEWIIENFILKNKLNELFAMPGQGKSFTSLDISLSVAQFANVIYIAAEDAEDYEERVKAWCQHHHADRGGLNFWPEAVNLFDRAAVDAFLAEVRPLNPALIVIDPLANCMVGSDESSTRDMNIAVETLNYIRRQTTAAILINHHTGWNDSHERGSSVLRGACRVVMKLTNTDGFLTLSCEKINGSKAFAPRYFRLVPSGDSVVLVPASKLSGRDGKLSQQQIDILDTLYLSVFADGASQSQLVEHLSVAKSSMHYSLSRLLDHGAVSKVGKGHATRYRITDSGIDILLEAQNEVVQSSPELSSKTTELSPNFTGLSLNWQVKSDALVQPEVQSNMAVESQSSVTFSQNSVKVQPEAQSSVQSLPLRETEQLNADQPTEQQQSDPSPKPNQSNSAYQATALPQAAGDYNHDQWKKREVEELARKGKLDKARQHAQGIRGKKLRAKVEVWLETLEGEHTRGST